MVYLHTDKEMLKRAYEKHRPNFWFGKNFKHATNISESRRVVFLPSSRGFIFLVIGVLALFSGVVSIGGCKQDFDICQNQWYRSQNEEACVRVDTCMAVGVTAVVLGAILVVRDVLKLWVEKRKPTHTDGTCPRCGAVIVRQSSPKTCFSCGQPIDWSRTKG